MNNLNKQNFFNELQEKYPEAIKSFCDFVDNYKSRIGWNMLFGGGVVASPKFHDLPYELQYGLLLQFFHTEGKLQFINDVTAKKFFEDMFQCVQNNTSYYAEPMSLGVTMIDIERRQHLHKHNHTADTDKSNNDGEIVKAAAAILLGDNTHYPTWWDIKFIEKMGNKTRIEKLVVAGSMIAAEIDRLLEEQKLDESTGNNSSGTGETEKPATNAD